jgi:hypothetical protein
VQTADIIAIYGAGLSSVLAFAQAATAWRGRARLDVSASFAYVGAGDFGTPVAAMAGRDVQEMRVYVEFIVRNVGGRPCQVSAVMIEAVGHEGGSRTIFQISPAGTLPVVLDPGTSVEVKIEKEHLDLAENLAFLGVVDGPGRRHSMPPDQARTLVREAWSLPTRVAVFQRRDDPTDRVVAFQVAEQAKFTQRPIDARTRKHINFVVSRPKSVMNTLKDHDQPRANAPSDASSSPEVSG